LFLLQDPQPKPTVIQKLKEEAFADIDAFLRRCFKSRKFPG
jgi:hypothetical protein